ncbi:MAG: alpha/beta hydrolase [Nannocystaceae bacterium]
MVTTGALRPFTARTCALASVCALAAACNFPSETGLFVPPTADEDPLLPQTSVFVADRIASVHIEAFGDKGNPTVLVLHGALSDYRSLGLFEELADDFRVVMWDRRGSGLSQRIDKAQIGDDFVIQEIEAIREQYAGDDPVAIVGHDFGAAHATAYAARYPDHVAALVLIEAPGLNGTIFSATYGQVFRFDLFDPAFNELQWDSQVLTAGNHERMDFKAVTVLEEGGLYNDYCGTPLVSWPVWRPGAYVYFEWRRQHGGRNGPYVFDYAAGISRWDGNALLLGSSCSALGAGYQAAYNAPLFDRPKVVEIPGSGHRMLVERPDTVLSEVRGHLDEWDD